MLPARTLRLLLILATVLGAARAGAQADAPSRAPARELRAVPGGVLVVVIESDVEIDSVAVRSAIARELGVRVEEPGAAPPGSARLELAIRDQGRQLDARFTSEDRTIARTIRLPEDRQATLETTALLAGNLVRNEAEELLAELERQRAEAARAAEAGAGAGTAAPAAPAPKPEAPPQKPVAPPPEDPEAERERELAAPPTTFSPINLTLVYPAVSLHRHSDRYTFAIELGLVYARLGRIEGAALDAFVHRIDHGLDGAALTGIWSHVDGRVRGAVLAGIGSSGSGSFEGAQLTGVVALHDGPFEGLQSSIVTLAWGRFHGAQLGTVNWAERIAGVQGGVVNVAREASGAALGVVNVARDIDGTQIGVTNVSQGVAGTQIGVINVAERVHGSQIGLINVADTVEGEQIGLISFGRVRPTTWADVDADRELTVHGGLKFQSRIVYSVFGFGLTPVSNTEQRYVSTAALGVRLPVQPLFFQVDAGMVGIHARDFSGDTPSLVRYRAALGLDLASWISVFAGGGVEHQVLPDTAAPRGLGLAGIELL